jgi:predicted HTH domain antitoxin
MVLVMTSVASVAIDVPSELLLEVHASPEEFAGLLKESTAIALFRQGRISSGLASKWLGQPRAAFLFMAMQQGARLLDQGQLDFERESSLP